VEIGESHKSGQASTLQLATSDLLNRSDWNHVHTIAYFAPGHLARSGVINNGRLIESVGEQGRPYVFKNPLNELAEDPRVSIF